MQHQIRDKRAQQVLFPSRVQQFHVQHADIRADFLGQYAPLTLYLFIIAPKPVDADDIQQIAASYLLEHCLISRPFKILTGLLIHKDILGRNAHLPHRDSLPVLVLIHARYTNVTKYPICHFLFRLSLLCIYAMGIVAEQKKKR